MDDIMKPKPNFNSTSNYTMFGETMGLNTQQKLILDMPTTLADFFEFLSSIDDFVSVSDGNYATLGAQISVDK